MNIKWIVLILVYLLKENQSLSLRPKRSNVILQAANAFDSSLDAAKQWSQVGVSAIDSSKDTFNGNMDKFVSFSQQAIDQNNLPGTSIRKNALQMGGNATKNAVGMFLSVPKVAVQTFGAIIGVEDKETSNRNGLIGQTAVQNDQNGDKNNDSKVTTNNRNGGNNGRVPIKGGLADTLTQYWIAKGVLTTTTQKPNEVVQEIVPEINQRVKRSGLVFDAANAFDATVDAAKQWSQVGVSAIEVTQSSFNENLDKFVRYSENAIDENFGARESKTMGKSGLQKGADLTKSLFGLFLSVPKVAVQTFGAVLGVEEPTTNTRNGVENGNFGAGPSDVFVVNLGPEQQAKRMTQEAENERTFHHHQLPAFGLPGNDHGLEQDPFAPVSHQGQNMFYDPEVHVPYKPCLKHKPHHHAHESFHGPEHFHGPPNHFQEPLDHFQGPPDHFHGPPDHFNGPPDHFNGPPCHFNGPPDHFHGPPSHLNGPSDHFNGSPDHFQGSPDHFNGSPDHFQGSPDHFSNHKPHQHQVEGFSQRPGNSGSFGGSQGSLQPDSFQLNNQNTGSSSVVSPNDFATDLAALSGSATPSFVENNKQNGGNGFNGQSQGNNEQTSGLDNHALPGPSAEVGAAGSAILLGGNVPFVAGGGSDSGAFTSNSNVPAVNSGNSMVPISPGFNSQVNTEKPGVEITSLIYPIDVRGQTTTPKWN